LPQPPLLAIDFDGTITVEDITNVIWDAHVPFDWRAVLMPPSRAGDITPLELIGNGYREVRRPADALLDEVRPHARLRPGFEALVAEASARGWPLHVVSHGLGFYLRALLPAGVAFTAFEGVFDGDRWASSCRRVSYCRRARTSRSRSWRTCARATPGIG